MRVRQVGREEVAPEEFGLGEVKGVGFLGEG